MNSDNESFVKSFIKHAQEHNDCLEVKDYSRRSRLNKKLMGMLKALQEREDREAIVSEIIDSGNDYAIMWISNYAMHNNMCEALVTEKLKAINAKKENPADAATAFVLLKHNSKI